MRNGLGLLAVALHVVLNPASAVLQVEVVEAAVYPRAFQVFAGVVTDGGRGVAAAAGGDRHPKVRPGRQNEAGFEDVINFHAEQSFPLAVGELAAEYAGFL